MPVFLEQSRRIYTGNGIATVYNMLFQYTDPNDVEVYLTSPSGVAALQYEGIHYTLSGQDDSDNGGVVTFLTPPPNAYEVLIRRNVPRTQPVALRTQGAYSPETLTKMADRNMMVIQQVARDADDAVDALREEVFAAIEDATIVGGAVSSSLVTATGGTVARSLADRAADVVHVKDHGAIGDGVVDDTAAIQRAVDFAIYTSKAKVILDPGVYKTTDTIHLGYGETFHSVVLEGPGSKYGGNNSAFAGASLVVTFTDRPAINIQGGRQAGVRGVALRGLLVAWVQSNHLGDAITPPTFDDTNPGSWDDTSFDPLPDTRYAPYAGVTFDAYSGVRPAESYPDVVYPGFTGINTQYGKAFSSDCFAEDMHITGFTVAVANQPCDADGNGDFTYLKRLNIDLCKWGISVCNTQARNTCLDNVKMGSVYCAITTRRHGRQNGRIGGVISNLSVGASIQIFDFHTASIAGPVLFAGLYGEALWRLGDLAANTSQENSIIISGGLFSFDLQGETQRGVPATLMGGGSQSCDVLFQGCSFTNFTSVCSFMETGVRFEGCQFLCTDRNTGVTPPAYARHAHNFLAGGVVLPYFDPGPAKHIIKHNLNNVDSGAWGANVLVGDNYEWGLRAYGLPYLAGSTQCQSDRYRETNALMNPSKKGRAEAKTAFLSVSLVGRVLTLVHSSLTTLDAMVDGRLPGDVIWDDQTGMVFFIRSRTTTTVIAEAQNNWKQDGVGGYTTILPFSSTVGTLYFGNARFTSTQYTLIGDLTSGNSVISNVGRADTFAAFIDTDLAVGDVVHLDDSKDRFVAYGNQTISAKDSTAKTITLGGNATYTQVRRRFPFFIRLPPSNRAMR